jgi:AAA15 family ATPase/GTPase
MIQELRIKNFLSFKDEVVFSFEATKDTTFEDYHLIEVAPGMRLLRFAVVYGANASGKSNLLGAFDFLSDFWFENRKDVDEETGTVPFRLDKITPDEPSWFSLKFYIGNTRYWYILEADEHVVRSEKLLYYTSVQPTLIFERYLENGVSVVDFNPAAAKISITARENINLKCLPNMSVFAARNQVNISIPVMDAARDWMKNSFMPVVKPRSGLFDFAETQLHTDELFKPHVLKFICEADFNISNVETQSVKQDIPQQLLDFFNANEDIPTEEKERLYREKSIHQIKTDFEHTVSNERGTEKYILPEELQSDGTHRIFGIEAAIYNALNQNAFLFIDEIESSLHPRLVEFILKKFLEVKDSRAQLLVTTHYDPLLNEVGELFRKDSVWFTDKNKAGATELYSLVEFSRLNRISSLQKAYRQGNFGAIPKVNI